MRNLVIRYIKDAEVEVAIEAGYFRKSVMGYVKFFEVGQIRQTRNFGQSI